MSVYAIGDVQGCYDDLCRLLDVLSFDPAHDQLWFTGDLVNKGPASARVLRFIRSLGERAVAVLGNHDLTLLADHWHGIVSKSIRSYCDVLEATDRDELIDWLRNRPMLHHDPELGFTIVHAGLAPQWDLATAQRAASELEQTLRSPECGAYLKAMFGDDPCRWVEELRGHDRLRFVTNCLTRLRFCRPDGSLEFREKGALGSQNQDLLPWFRVPGRRWQGERIVFGHWAMLGVHQENGVFGLDSGCVYRRGLTALRLDGEPKHFSVACAGC